MTPKEKAEEIYKKFINVDCLQEFEVMDYELAKQCALILVDENVKMLKIVLDESTDVYQSLNTPKKLCIDLLNPLLKYWREVKKEIKKL